MKRMFTFLCLSVFLLLSATAQINQSTDDQPLVNKRGKVILPQAGDFAIGIDASPFLKYIGNTFNGSTENEEPTFSNYGIHGKYFVKDNQAIRVRLNFGFNQNKSSWDIEDDLQVSTNPYATVEDIRKYSYNNFDLSAGYEFRKGFGRLQAFYGGMINFSYSGHKVTYDYGNKITADNPYPSSSFRNASRGYRETEERRNGWGAGLRAFIGAEYFFAPKISVGGEYGLGIGYNTAGKYEIQSEGWENNTLSKYEYTIGSSNSLIGFNTISQGKIFLALHF